LRLDLKCSLFNLQCVVALTIIFAIQRCDPAPFYLFDEVDANLDPMYRGAVANMISSQKLAKDGDPNSSVQFLTSSFHEELVKAADRHWIVSHSGMSRINQGQLEDQLKIVRKNAQTAPAGAGGSAAGRR
jgi:structural maintenance of chromosome 3 (chondroitin sulfate proteoglycan 6)